MRITVLITQSLESPSGVGRYWPLCRELARLGHNVTILALHHDYSRLRYRYFVKDGVHVYYVGQMHIKKEGNHKSYFPLHTLVWVATFATLNLANMALRIPTDIYHIGKPHPMNGIAAILAHIINKKPLYLDCDDYEAASNRFESNWQKYIVTLFEDRIPYFAKGITVNTRFILERLKRIGYLSKQIVLVPNGVDRQRFLTPYPDRGLLRQRLGLSDNKVVVYVGTLGLVNHAVDLLIDAFASVQRYEPRSVLLLVGRGEDYEKLKAYSKELGLQRSVRFIGWIPPEMVPMYYYVADLSVDPTRDTLAERARCPLKIVESLAVGTPVVTASVGDRPEMLSSGGGLIVPPGDPKALAEAMLAILQDDALRARLSLEALVAREKYYWDRLVHNFIKVYEETL